MITIIIMIARSGIGSTKTNERGRKIGKRIITTMITMIIIIIDTNDNINNNDT